MSHDLFGDPVPHLTKNANGYLTSLAQLTLEDGWMIWSLAEPGSDRPRPAEQFECVWLLRQGDEPRKAYIDLMTGQEAT